MRTGMPGVESRVSPATVGLSLVTGRSPCLEMVGRRTTVPTPVKRWWYMSDRIVVRADLPTQVEELIVLVGRERLLDLIVGANTWTIQRDTAGLTLCVDGLPVVFEDGSDGSWVPVALSVRRPGGAQVPSLARAGAA